MEGFRIASLFLSLSRQTHSLTLAHSYFSHTLAAHSFRLHTTHTHSLSLYITSLIHTHHTPPLPLHSSPRNTFHLPPPSLHTTQLLHQKKFFFPWRVLLRYYARLESSPSTQHGNWSPSAKTFSTPTPNYPTILSINPIDISPILPSSSLHSAPFFHTTSTRL
ncbi:MAG: hypothetical protein J3Q66DRAFT_354169 [Benniella sp.]|nr:MAG: hypothetical protein J3Q66DRAFT_354169 [Benniella sp.]